MLFHTPQFGIFFIVLVPLFAWCKAHGRAPLALLLASQVFYGWWDWRFLILLWITILLDYTLARRIHSAETQIIKKMLLITSVTASLSLLGFFKYWNFIVGSATTAGITHADALKITNLILPVGISFYTFQSLGYVIDVYRGHDRPVRNLIHYATFVCYFPHMVAGPIMRIGRLLPSLVRPESFSADRLLSGLLLFSYGFASKALGDVLAGLHDPVFLNLSEATPAAAVFAVVSFGFQIYFDFLGYCEMARGISRILGIELMRNFRAPYTATSFQEFWRRWHISLSEWLRDYLYIPLGGNRVSPGRRLANLMATMVLGGLWHGAGWNFLIWGGLHGAYLCANAILQRSVGARLPNGGWFGRLRATAGWLITMAGVTYAWLYFRVPTLEGALLVNQKIYQWIQAPGIPAVAWGVAFCVAAFIALDLMRRSQPDVFSLHVAGVRRSFAYGALSGAFATLGLVLLVGTPSQQFIYFQF